MAIAAMMPTIIMLTSNSMMLKPLWRISSSPVTGPEPDAIVTNAVRQWVDLHHIGTAEMVVAVSGGIDSTALLVALAERGDLALTAGHVNHHLRGAESDGDEAFIRDLCARLGVPLRVPDGTL